jgi:hypothetical protein
MGTPIQLVAPRQKKRHDRYSDTWSTYSTDDERNETSYHGFIFLGQETDESRVNDKERLDIIIFYTWLHTYTS